MNSHAAGTVQRAYSLFGGPDPRSVLGGAFGPVIGPGSLFSTPVEDVVGRPRAASAPTLSTPIVSTPIVSPSLSSVSAGPAAAAPVLTTKQRLDRDKATLIARMAPGDKAVDRLLKKIIKTMDTSADPHGSVSTSAGSSTIAAAAAVWNKSKSFRGLLVSTLHVPGFKKSGGKPTNRMRSVHADYNTAFCYYIGSNKGIIHVG